MRLKKEEGDKGERFARRFLSNIQSCREVRVWVSLAGAVSAGVKVQTRLSAAPKRGWQVTKGNNGQCFLKV